MGSRMELFVIGVSGPPMSGKSTFCKAFGEHIRSLNREVRIFNLDPACEVYLAYDADWNITSFIKVKDIMREETLGFNGALLRAMTILEQQVSVLLEELRKLPRNTFVILDLPGQVRTFLRKKKSNQLFLSFYVYRKSRMFLTLYLVDNMKSLHALFMLCCYRLSYTRAVIK